MCAEALSSGQIKDESALFFCLQVVDDYVKSRYATDMESQQVLLKQTILLLFDKDMFDSNYLQNKFASLVNSVFLVDFPVQKWANFFKDFLQKCNSPVKCDVFLRMLIQINYDIADKEIPRTNKVFSLNNCLFVLQYFLY